MLASTVSPLTLMTFLNTLMQALGSVSLTYVGYCSFMYGNLVIGSNIGCTTCGWYHGGINMHGSGVGNPKDPTSGLNGRPLGRSPPNELPLGEFPSCLPFDGLWVEPLGTSVGKLVVTYKVVGTNVVTGC
jgi:hypothetical protein